MLAIQNVTASKVGEPRGSRSPSSTDSDIRVHLMDTVLTGPVGDTVNAVGAPGRLLTSLPGLER